MKKRKINEIIVHCSATIPSFLTSIEDIRRWHKARGFDDIGYHFVIDINGDIHEGRPMYKVGAHCKGHNANSVGICYIGGLDIDRRPFDTRTNNQRIALFNLISYLCSILPITKISSHYEYSNKSCPCFDASKEYSHLIQKLL